jgi:predicted ferric reductase
MKKIKFGLCSILIGISLVWLLANLPFSESFRFGVIRNYLIQYSGILGITTMSIAMILATRPSWAESLFGG